MSNTRRTFASRLCWSLILMQVVGLSSWADSRSKLYIAVVGENPLNDIPGRIAREPIVQLMDKNHKPIAGMPLIFTLPKSGPSGTFDGGGLTFSTSTGQDGKAIATGFKPNNAVGNYKIRITIQNGKSKLTAAIKQRNFISNLTPNSISSVTYAAGSIPLVTAHVLTLNLALIGTAVAGGAVAGGVVALKSGSSPIVISPGGTTVGAPQSQRQRIRQ